MKQVKKSVLLWYSPAEMYSLVTGVEQYPQFLPWCASTEVLERREDGLTARITLRLPENLKATIELVAGREGMSINTWLVRALARAVSTPSTPRRSSNRLTGFGRS